MSDADQGVSQSYDAQSAAEAFIDRLDPMDSAEQPEDELAGDDDEGELLDLDEGDELDDTDETDADDDTDDDADEDDDGDGEEDDDTDAELFEVVIDGQTQKVNREELVAGYQRQADYTRKTQELAAQRQQAEQYLQQNHQYLTQQTQQLSALTELLEQQTIADKNIDWDRLSQEDPAMYIRMKEAAGQRKELFNQALQQQEQVKQYEATLQQQKHAEYVESQRQALMQEWKHWADPEVAKREQSEIRDYLLSNGIPESDVRNLADFNVLKLVDKARKYDQLKNKNPRTKQRLRDAPKVIKPKSTKTRTEQRKTSQSAKHKRLKQTGSVQDAASLLFDRV